MDALFSPKDKSHFRRIVKKYSYIFLALYVPIYLAAFFWVESYVTTDYWVSYLPIDSMIPFLEGFVIAYYLWYPFMVVTGVYLLFKDVPAFKRYMWFIIISFSLSIIIFALFPNGQDLRPVAFERDNLCTKLVQAIYSVDTNTNVLPSVHVIGSLAVVFAFFDSKALKGKLLRILSLIVAVLISMSTVFIKQHSVLDIIAGGVLCIPVYLLVYRKNINRGIGSS